MIQVSDVTYCYDSDSAPALSHVSLDIRDGEMVAVVGHNGSGKSTLAKCLNGLLLPTEGTVSVNGMLTSDESSLLSIRQHVGIVFQNPDNQLVTTIVEEDVAFGPENLGIAPDEIDVKRAEEARIRAERRLQEKAAGTNLARASLALQRSIARIEAAKK